MSYRRCCINVGVDLLPLKEDSFDPNEADPELVDDSVALYMDALEKDTLQLYTSDEESEGEEEEAPTPDPPSRTREVDPNLPSELQQAIANTSSAAQGSENVPLVPIAPNAQVEVQANSQALSSTESLASAADNQDPPAPTV